MEPFGNERFRSVSFHLGEGFRVIKDRLEEGKSRKPSGDQDTSTEVFGLLRTKRRDKRLRARGGCLGTCWRRRTEVRPRKSTVSCLTSVDPYVSEWGNPMEVTFHNPGVSKVASGSKRRELKHLSTCRKRNQVRDTPSSGERNG